MTQLIVYINSEQKAAAYYDKSYVSFHGARYEANPTEFAKILKKELRVNTLSEVKDGISVLIVSDGATNKTVRTVISNLLHTDEDMDEDAAILNVDIQEINIIESKYILQLLGNPESPEAEDFAQFFEIEKKSLVNAQELEELKSKLTELQGELENKNSEISELQSFKESVIKEKEKEIEKQTIKAKDEINKKIDDSNRICKINIRMDCKETEHIVVQPDPEIIKIVKSVRFHRLKKDQIFLTSNTVIGTYNAAGTQLFLAPYFMGLEISKKTKRDGKVFYVVEDDSSVRDGAVVAVIGDEDWTTKDVVECLKRNSYNIPYVNKYENNPLIYDTETH